LGSSASSIVFGPSQVLGSDPLIKLAQGLYGPRSQGIPLSVLNARRMREDGFLELVGQEVGAIQEFVATETARTILGPPLWPMFSSQLINQFLTFFLKFER
jgi:hypothetical protein